jgi:hypothetical protein
MKKNILLIITVFLLYVSSSALEPVRIGLNYPTGASFKVELNDYTDPNNPIKKYPLPAKPDFEKTLTPNTSGVVSFVVGEGDPDWGGIAPTAINPNVIVDVIVSGNLVAQYNLLDMITTQASTGNGNILNDGFTSAEGVTFPDTTNLTNDFVFGSVKLNRLSSVEETKFFFDHSKAAFRTGKVNTPSWNEANLGDFSFAAGKDNKASGKGAVAFGEGTTAPSYGEVAIGSYNTTYVPNSATAIDNNDRAFVIGNGTAGTPSDAFIIQKNGNMTVGGSLTVLGATVTNSNLTVGGTTIDPNTGNLIVAGTTTMNGNASVTGANTFSVGNGLTTLGGGLTVTAGNIQATAGSISAGTTVTAGTGVTATTGGITADAGNITATLGNIEATAGSISAGTTVTAGTGVTATTGGVTADAGNITATLGNIEATAGSVSAGTTVTAGTGVTATTGGVTADAGNITATLGNIEATAGSITAGNGLTVSAGNTTLTSLGASGNRSLYVDNTGVVTASNGSAARQASGMFTATATLTGGAATEAITNTNVTATSVVIITYFGGVNESVRITVQGAGSFTVSTEGTNFTAGDKIHYMIINN